MLDCGDDCMSRKAVQGFLAKIEADSSFAIQAMEYKRVKDLAQFAGAAGYDFTDEEFIEMTKVPPEKRTDSLMEVMDQLLR